MGRVVAAHLCSGCFAALSPGEENCRRRWRSGWTQVEGGQAVYEESKAPWEEMFGVKPVACRRTLAPALCAAKRFRRPPGSSRCQRTPVFWRVPRRDAVWMEPCFLILGGLFICFSFFCGRRHSPIKPAGCPFTIEPHPTVSWAL